MPTVDTFISPLSFSAVKLEATLAEPTTAQFRADAERLSHIIMEMQRCFLLHLCKELAPGNVSFSQYFLLAALDQKEVLTMSAIAQKMGHTTAAASGLVARLENLGYVTRLCHACIRGAGSAKSDGLHYLERFSPGAAHPRGDDGQPDEVDGTSDAIGKQGVVANLQ